MRHHVGVATDGRREVRIPPERQPEVAQIIGAIPGFRHRSHGQLLQQVLLRLALDAVHEMVHGVGDVFRVVNVQFVAEPFGKRRQVVESFFVGVFVNPINHRVRGRERMDKLGHALVGEEHKLFDEFVGVLPDFGINTQRYTVLVEFEFYFHRLKIDSPALEPHIAEFVG